MTEPGVASSDATNMEATAVVDGDLDGAVALLTRHPGHEQYAEGVRRLDAAGPEPRPEPTVDPLRRSEDGPERRVRVGRDEEFEGDRRVRDDGPAGRPHQGQIGRSVRRRQAEHQPGREGDPPSSASVPISTMPC